MTDRRRTQNSATGGEHRRFTVGLATLAGVASLLATPAPSFADNALFAGASADGSHAYFITRDRLVPEEPFQIFADLFDRTSTGTSLATGVGSNSGSFIRFKGANADGSIVFFETRDPLDPVADTDGSLDIYQRSGGVTSLVSEGEINGNGAFAPTFKGMSSDGTRVFFTTQEQLVSADTDTATDLYERSGGTTTRVSAGIINGNSNSFGVVFGGTSADGTRVFFSTNEALISSDSDSVSDVYQRSGGVTTRVSAGAVNGNGGVGAFFADASADGTRVLFTTSEQLVTTDDDNVTDIYQRLAGTTTRVSTGQINGNGAADVSFRGASDDAARVYFTTIEQLVTGDTDSSQDIYLRGDGVTTRVSTGPGGGNGAFVPVFNTTTPDGLTAFITTGERLVNTDTDNQLDIYKVAAGTTTQVSRGGFLDSDTGEEFSFGNGPFDTIFAGSAPNGDVFWETAEPMDKRDGDDAVDVFRRSALGNISLISVGAINGNGGSPARFGAASSDGLRVYFTSFEQLSRADIDQERDVYERSSVGTTLVSVERFPPDTTIGAGVAEGGATNDATPAFEFTASETGSTFECKVNTGAFNACTSPKLLGPFADGPVTFEVRATDVAGNTDPGPDIRTFTVDTEAPDPSIDSGPSGPTQNAAPTFTFSADEPATFRCRVDGASFAPCSGPGDSHTTGSLADGSHRFSVRARDAAGNIETDFVRFNVDTVAPQTAIDSVTVSGSQAEVHFSGTDPSPGTGVASFECRIDAGPFQACSSPRTFIGLSPGSHTVRARAIDAAGNIDQTSAPRTFTV